MGLQYGKRLAEQTIRYISSSEDVLNRLLKGWSEISVGHDVDFPSEVLKRKHEWISRYLSSGLDPSRKTLLSKEDSVLIRELLEELVSICIEIIEGQK